MYSRENFEKVKNEITNRRLSARAEADRRNEELRELSPEIEAIDSELTKTGVLIFRTACAGGDIEAVKKRNQELMAKRRQLVASLGYPEDYTDVHYTCPECSDTGYVNEGTRMCKCFREGLIRETCLSSGMGNLIDKQTFDNFSLDRFKNDPESHKHMSSVLKEAKKFVAAFPKKRESLLLVGKSGTGKTHISSAIAREVINLGYDVVYDTIQNIVDDFEADRFHSGYNTQAERKGDKYLECDLLIIDDLGTEFKTQYSLSVLYNLLATRYNKNLATILSTNLDMKDLSSFYEGRICSRLLGKETRVLMFIGNDARIYG
jgi:DNA replication protein DnaC